MINFIHPTLGKLLTVFTASLQQRVKEEFYSSRPSLCTEEDIIRS